MRISIVLSVLVIASISLADSGWFIEGGVWYRGGMKLDITGRSEDVAYSFESAAGGRATVPTGSLQSDNGSGARYRSFDDGFVGPSDDSIPRSEGRTQYFGYQRNNQVDGNRLRFRQTLTDSGSVDRQSSSVIGENARWAGSDSSGSGVGGVVTVGRVMVMRPRYDWSFIVQGGWLNGISWNVDHLSDERVLLQTTTERSSYEIRETWQFSYDTRGSIMPSAPYSSSSSGSSTVWISDTPESVQQVGDRVVSESDQVVGRSVTSVSSDVSVRVDARTFIFGVGPRLQVRLHDRIAMFTQGGLTINLIDVDMDRHEVFRNAAGATLLADSLQDSKTAWRPGLSLSAGFSFVLPQNMFTQLGLAYDYVDTYDFSFGPDRLRMDVSGYRVDAAFGWRFGAGD